MSLPIIGGKPGPASEPTHKPLALDQLMRLGVSLEDAMDEAGAEQLTTELIVATAADMGVPPSHLYAAAAMTMDADLARDDDVTFVVCAGKCQAWGALDRIDRLVQIREDRLDAGETGFNIHARGCLDKCSQAPVMFVHSPDGLALLTATSDEDLAGVVSQICDG